ncbi:unnamed protein product [Fraxinus pennsylvanica]|uniref:NADP-dependent oxidoreductase domain-containing protein n=1 Tax=Fraxinus pennsylvanica TaxID=56036 RepID=A0AAD1ZCP4_9LAMI|nr:unnamed protein product [Fraxinus pennsylvanica]
MRKIVELATKLSLNNRMGRWSYMETLPMSACEASLKRLDIDCVDFYYQHRIEKRVPIEVTETIQALQSTHQYNASKEQEFILTEISFGQWKDQNEVWKSCWRVPSLEGKSFGGYVFFSLSNGTEYHAPQIVVGVARHLGATLVLPDIRGTKLKKKEILEKFMMSRSL